MAAGSVILKGCFAGQRIRARHDTRIADVNSHYFKRRERPRVPLWQFRPELPHDGHVEGTRFPESEHGPHGHNEGPPAQSRSKAYGQRHHRDSHAVRPLRAQNTGRALQQLDCSVPQSRRGHWGTCQNEGKRKSLATRTGLPGSFTVEAEGIEPSSASTLQTVLHT